MYAIVDVETTGLSPSRDHILEVAIIQFDGATVENRYEQLVQVPVNIPAEIQALTGIRPEALTGALPFSAIARDVVQLTEGRTLVGHNIRFDVSFLRAQFRSLGYNYWRKQLCTLRLARQLLPGRPSYSLQNLRRALKLNSGQAHRAMGDAETTLALFELLQEMSVSSGAEADNTRVASQVTLPPAIRRKQIDEIPHVCGVYYFYDKHDRPIYVGKSIHLRRRVLDHFSNDIHYPKDRQIKELTERISFEITGSELVALLLESEEIKRLRPTYNASQRAVNYRYGVFNASNKAGYQQLSMELLSRARKPEEALQCFVNRYHAEQFLKRMCETFELCEKFAGLYRGRGPCFAYHLKKCRGACAEKESPVEYNRRLQAALGSMEYMYPSFFIIGAGRSEAEQSVVAVENGVYKGFGFVPDHSNPAKTTELRRAITTRPETQDIRRIIQRYLATDHSDTIVQGDEANIDGWVGSARPFSE